jgi:hypothetical protein
MELKGLVGKAQEFAGAATETANSMMKEFNEALPTLRALGFTIKDLRAGMGIIPEVGVKLVASADTVDSKKIKELIEKNPANKTLVTALNGLLAAYNLKQQIGDFPYKGVEIDLKLGLPPHIGVSFLSATPVAAVGAIPAAASGFGSSMQV